MLHRRLLRPPNFFKHRLYDIPACEIPTPRIVGRCHEKGAITQKQVTLLGRRSVSYTVAYNRTPLVVSYVLSPVLDVFVQLHKNHIRK